MPSAQNSTSVPLLLSVFERFFMSSRHLCHNCLFGTTRTGGFQEMLMLIDANVSVPVDLLLCVLFDSVHVGVSVCFTVF